MDAAVDEDTAAVLFGAFAPFGRMRIPFCLKLNLSKLAEGIADVALSHNFVGFIHGQKEPVILGNHQFYACVPGNTHHLLSFVQSAGYGFFDENMFAVTSR